MTKPYFDIFTFLWFIKVIAKKLSSENYRDIVLFSREARSVKSTHSLNELLF